MCPGGIQRSGSRPPARSVRRCRESVLACRLRPRKEHRHIPPALAGVDAALRGGAELTASVELLSAVVLDHLAHEERGVLPLIEQHLTRAHWRAFLHKERSRPSPRERPEFLAWILDDASEQDAAAVLTEMPPPARLVYRRVLRPSYDAQHRWQIPSPVAEP
jgi:hypothetical protein